MIDSKFKKPGKLVKFRGRRCVVQPSTEDEIIILKPLGGSDDEIITINSIGTKNKFEKPITLKIQPGTYNTIATLQNAINSIFNTVTYGIDFSKSSLILEYAPNNKINCTLIIQITTKITEADYSLYFYDNDLSNSSIQYINMPKYYANWDEEFWVVAPTPDKTYAITLAYNKEPESITSTTLPTTANPFSTIGTYLSNKYQDLLLYACLVNAYGYLKGPVDMLQYYSQEYEKALESYAVEQIGQRRRDEYKDGVVRAQLISKSPSSYK